MNKEKSSLLKEVSPSTAKSYAGSYERLRKILELKDKRKPITRVPIDTVLDILLQIHPSFLI
jgi:hypothetical protein